ncbi:MAG: alpha-L-fucosidase [Bacteroidales bacterium]
MNSKTITFILIGFVLNLFFTELAGQEKEPSKAWKEREERTRWFQNDRFGMFIHWGIYAIPARGEWVRNKEEITIEEYQPFFEQFNPVDYNPSEWAKLAKKAGMKYAVMTAKHHDGFCLWDTKYTEYKVTNTPAKRDLLKEYVEAFRAEGLKVGLYYSLVDWYHPDYPAYGDYSHPMRENEDWKNKTHDFDNYIKYMHNQVEELVTNYGKIDILWFDFSYGEMKGEKWEATKLVKMARKHQPGVLIDNRLGGRMESREPEVYAGDFEGPEQYIPEKGVFDDDGFRIPWEACITMNNSWGYNMTDNNFKSPDFIIQTLVNCVSKGGNLLLNVGPDALGNIPDKSVETLLEIGEWMDKNSESIYGCGPSDYEEPQWGRYTQKENVIYAHVLRENIGHFVLPGLKDKIQSATLLRDGTEAILTEWWLGREKSFIHEEDIFFNFGKPVPWTYELPDPTDTVIKIVLNEE